jgi:lysozyme
VGGCSPSARPCVQRASLTVCAGPQLVQGIDVSTYQGAIDWSAVAGAGIAFAFARVSDGTTHPDDQFVANWSGMRAHGVLRGLYQFFRASEDPIAQAELVLQNLKQHGPADLPIVMDIETADGQAPATVQARMHDWFDHLQAAGQRTLVYTAEFMSSTIGSGFAAAPLWVANYGVSCPTLPSGWSQWQFWQRADNGHVAGIGPAVDLDEFNGPAAALHGFADGSDGGAPGVGATDGGAPGGGCS